MDEKTFTVNCARLTGSLTHFWQATGFTPAKLLLNADMQQTLDYLGGIPRGGITHVRIHFLLDLVEIIDVRSREFNWTKLDTGLDVLIRNGLKPFFELMGNPSGHFDDFTDDAQLHLWRDMVTALAQRYSKRYGVPEVESWYFETWNEPDIPFWPFDDAAFCNYYDACSEGLKAANPNLVFGGPGTARTLSDTFKTLLAHCDTGTNYFTGETSVRLDFISVHEKGVRSHDEDLNPNAMGIVEREAAAIDYIRVHHPRFADLPFMNDECDPQVGWSKIHTWRGKPYYAAIACKIIDQHQRRLKDDLDCNYAILSNDNGFLGSWGNRTLVTRFSESNKALVGGQAEFLDSGKRYEMEQAPPFTIIKKPILNAMVALAHLGESRLSIEGASHIGDELGILATRHARDQVTVLLYNSRDTIMSSGETAITLNLENLPFDSGYIAHYRIDETHSNPFAIWEETNAPDMPDATTLKLLREHQELALLVPPEPFRGSQVSLTFTLPLPAVSLIILTDDPGTEPLSPGVPRFTRYPGRNGQQDLMICWAESPSRTIATYEVLWSTEADGLYQRINPVDTLCTAYLHPLDRDPAHGYYRIRAVDYWGRTADSAPIQYDPSR